jgi:hypothetical protein
MSPVMALAGALAIATPASANPYSNTDGYCEQGRICFWENSYETGRRFTYRPSYGTGFNLQSMANKVSSIMNHSGDDWTVFDWGNCDPGHWHRYVYDGATIDNMYGSDWQDRISSTSVISRTYAGPPC